MLVPLEVSTRSAQNFIVTHPVGLRKISKDDRELIKVFARRKLELTKFVEGASRDEPGQDKTSGPAAEEN